MTSIINRTLLVQKITIGIATLAFFGLVYIVFSTDPFSASHILCLFFVNLVVLFAAIYLLVIFIFQLNVRKILMGWTEVVNSMYYSVILSIATVLTMVLAMVEQLNIISVLVIVAGLTLYWFANN